MWRPRKSLGLGMANLIILSRKKEKIHINHQKFSFFHFLEKIQAKIKTLVQVWPKKFQILIFSCAFWRSSTPKKKPLVICGEYYFGWFFTNFLLRKHSFNLNKGMYEEDPKFTETNTCNCLNKMNSPTISKFVQQFFVLA